MTEYVTREHLKLLSDGVESHIKKQHLYVYRRLDDIDNKLNKVEHTLADFEERLEEMDHMIETIDWDVHFLKKFKK